MNTRNTKDLLKEIYGPKVAEELDQFYATSYAKSDRTFKKLMSQYGAVECYDDVEEKRANIESVVISEGSNLYRSLTTDGINSGMILDPIDLFFSAIAIKTATAVGGLYSYFAPKPTSEAPSTNTTATSNNSFNLTIKR